MKKLVLLSAAVLVAVGTSFAGDGIKLKKHKKERVTFNVMPTKHTTHQSSPTDTAHMVFVMLTIDNKGDKKSPLFFVINLHNKVFYIIFDIQLNTKGMLTETELRKISNLAKRIFDSQRALELVAGAKNHYHIGQINKRIKEYETELKSIVLKLE